MLADLFGVVRRVCLISLLSAHDTVEINAEVRGSVGRERNLLRLLMAFRNDPQLRVIPDTNTWLDAAFLTDSVARRALVRLQASGKPLIVEELIENEVFKILAKRRIELGLSFDPCEHFKAFTAGFLRVPTSNLVQVNVNKADLPVARAAVHYQATLLTQDAPLVAQCLADGI